jgi:hypothetical protein
MRLSKILVATLVLGVTATATARATATKLWTVCGGNTFATCAAVEVTVTGEHVVMRVFTAIGLFNLPASVSVGAANLSMTGPKRPGDIPGPWVAGQDQQVGGGVNLDVLVSTPNGINNGIASECAAPGQLPGGINQFWMNPCTVDLTNPGGFVVISFDVSDPTLPSGKDAFDPNLVGLLVKGQNGPNGASTECITAGSQLNCQPVTVTPEPVSLVLLGSGLVGMGGVGTLRRRKKLIDG